jgi:hypothetical protein
MRHSALRISLGGGVITVTRRTPVKAEQLSEFETLCATEKVATQRALDKCRGLADRIKSELRKEKPEPFDHVVALADFLASLERAASAPRREESNVGKK